MRTLAVLLLAIPNVAFAQDAPSEAIVLERLHQGKFADADDFRKRLVATSEADPKALVLARDYLLGVWNLRQGLLDAAQTPLEKTIAELDRLKIVDDPLRDRAINDLGVIAYQRGDYAAAQKRFAEAYEHRKKRTGEIDADTLQSLRNLAFAERGLGNEIKAQQLFKQSHQGLENLLASEKTAIASSCEAVEFVETRAVFPRIQILKGVYAPFVPPREIKPNPDAARAQILERLGVVGYQIVGLRSPGEYTAKAYGLCKKIFGPDDPRSAAVMFNHFSMDPGSNSLANLDRSADILTKTFGPSHLVHVTYARNKMISLTTANRADDAVAVAAEALKNAPPHPAWFDLREAAGLAFQASNNVPQAASQFSQVYIGRGRHFGVNHPATATAASALAVAFYYLGDFAKAKTLLNGALRVRRIRLGDDHPDTARLLSDCVAIARDEGDYPAAVALVDKAYESLLKSLGPNDVDTTTAKANRYVIRMEMGDYDGAAEFFTQLVNDPKTPPFQRDDALVNLGGIAREKKDFPLARKIFDDLLKSNPQREPEVRNNLAGIARDTGDPDLAFALYEKVLAIRKKQSDESPNVAFTLTSLGLLHQERGRYAEAEDAFQKALAIYRKQLGEKSRPVANVQQFLGVCQMLAGKNAEARKSLEAALTLKTTLAHEILPKMSEAEALAFAGALEERDPLLAVLRSDRKGNSAAAYDAVWATRGLATRAISSRRVSGLQEARTIPEAARLLSVRRRIAALIREDDPTGKFGPARSAFDLKTFEALNQEKETLEKALAKKFADDPSLVKGTRNPFHFDATVQELRDRLPADTALIDLLKVKVWDGPERKPAWSYEAFVLRSGDAAPTWIGLGPADAIDKEVKNWRAKFGNGSSAARGFAFQKPAVADDDAPDVKLRDLVWSRLSPAVKDAKNVIVMADGELTRLPWGALPSEDGKSFLIERHAFSTASYGQQLVALLKAPTVKGDKGLVLGGLAFDEVEDAPKGRIQTLYREPTSRHDWSPLPGTLKEIREIEKLAPDSVKFQTIEGAAGRPRTVCDKMTGVRYLHLATHGYFASPDQTSPLTPKSDVTASLNAAMFDGRRPLVKLTGRNPLILSGLVLSGANIAVKKDGPPIDSILTAEEIVDLNLSDAELVVLSACETGLGEVAGGEGVFSLQRAFGLAGARATVGSLWTVDDASTERLMVEFYKNLWQKKMPKAEALRTAQIAILRGYDPKTQTIAETPREQRLAPYYWAAFVLSGDWR